MGNRNANEQNNNGFNEQILPQNAGNAQMRDPPSVKKVFAVRNPINIKKQTLSLEKNVSSQNQYYLKFNYDALVNFNCYINFHVSKNSAKPLIPKDNSQDNYILSYIPSTAMASKSITLKNIPKGENMEFFEKDAIIDIEFLKNNKSENSENETYDLSIEIVPIFEVGSQEYNEKNEIVFLSLCQLELDDAERHGYGIKIESQKLKTYGMWIEVHEIFDCSLDNGECLICCAALRNTIFLPCYHSCTCNMCAHSLKMRNNSCPICKNPINDLLILETDDNKNTVPSSDINELNNNEIINVRDSERSNNENNGDDENNYMNHQE